MEQFLRTYYTNLNPNATEEEILAFLASQGFGGMGGIGSLGGQTSTGTGGITDLRSQMLLQQQQQQFGNDGINNVITGRGAKEAPNAFIRALATIFSPPIGVAMNLQDLADKGKLPRGLDKVFKSEPEEKYDLESLNEFDYTPTMQDPDPAEEAGMGFGGGRSDPTDKS